jgi:hypothetical protein
MELLRPRSVAASQLLGTTAAESAAVFERIKALREVLPGETERALELELGWVLHARGEYNRARALAACKVELAERRGDRRLHLSACDLMGATLFFHGDLLRRAALAGVGIGRLRRRGRRTGPGVLRDGSRRVAARASRPHAVAPGSDRPSAGAQRCGAGARDDATRNDVKELKLAHARLSEGFDTALAGRIGRLLGARPRRA